MSLHGVGTVALGAGLFLAGQLFHLEAHWPLGLLLWAIGAGLGWALLRQWPQLALLALLGPAWLLSEWQRAVDTATEALQRGSGDPTAVLAPAAGLVLLNLCYLAAPAGAGPAPAPRRVLLWLGGLGLLPAGLLWQLLSHGGPTTASLPLPLALVGWAVALGAPCCWACACGAGAPGPWRWRSAGCCREPRWPGAATRTPACSPICGGRSAGCCWWPGA